MVLSSKNRGGQLRPGFPVSPKPPSLPPAVRFPHWWGELSCLNELVLRQLPMFSSFKLFQQDILPP